MLYYDFLLRAAAAILLGGLIGLERQLTGHRAGIRINILVSFGACTFVLFSTLAGAADSTRIAAQIVSGVGFLCSAIIFKDGVGVRGLNTAATIWCTAAIGMLASSGYYLIAVSATGLLLLVNIVFRFISNRVQPLGSFDESEHIYKVTIQCLEPQEFKLRALLMNACEAKGIVLTHLESVDMIGEKVEIEADFHCMGRRRDDIFEALVEKCALEKDVLKLSWELV